MKRLEYYKDLVLVLTQKEMKVRYKNHLLGYLWSILNPLAFALCFYVAFKIIMRFEMDDYTVFLICGLFPWQWFSTSLTMSASVFLRNASLIKRVSFPRTALPLSVVLQDMIHFLLSIPVIVLFLLLHGHLPSASWIYGIPLLLLVQLLVTYGLVLAIATTNLFFRDLERLVLICTTLLFYLTPIIYPVTMVPEPLRPLLTLNPAAPIMTNWRELFLHGSIDGGLVLLSFVYGALLCLVGYLVYRRLSWKFAEVL